MMTLCIGYGHNVDKVIEEEKWRMLKQMKCNWEFEPCYQSYEYLMWEHQELHHQWQSIQNVLLSSSYNKMHDDDIPNGNFFNSSFSFTNLANNLF